MTITLELSKQLDDQDLSECVVLHHALEMYRHHVKQAKKRDGLCPVYADQAYRIADDLIFQLTQALMGIDQPEVNADRELMNILLNTDSRKGGCRS